MSTLVSHTAKCKTNKIQNALISRADVGHRIGWAVWCQVYRKVRRVSIWAWSVLRDESHWRVVVRWNSLSIYTLTFRGWSTLAKKLTGCKPLWLSGKIPSKDGRVSIPAWSDLRAKPHWRIVIQRNSLSWMTYTHTHIYISTVSWFYNRVMRKSVVMVTRGITLVSKKKTRT